jgi:hypothetical protein
LKIIYKQKWARRHNESKRKMERELKNWNNLILKVSYFKLIGLKVLRLNIDIKQIIRMYKMITMINKKLIELHLWEILFIKMIINQNRLFEIQILNKINPNYLTICMIKIHKKNSSIKLETILLPNKIIDP